MEVCFFLTGRDAWNFTKYTLFRTSLLRLRKYTLLEPCRWPHATSETAP